MGSDVSEKIKKIIENGTVYFNDSTKLKTSTVDAALAEVRFKKQSERGWDRRGKKRAERPPVGKKDPLPPITQEVKRKVYDDFSLADFEFSDLNDTKDIEPEGYKPKTLKELMKEMGGFKDIKFSMDMFDPPPRYRDRFDQYGNYRRGSGSNYRRSFQDMYSLPIERPRTLLEEEWSSDKTYITYTDLNDYMANRIATDTGQQINLVARTLRAAREQKRESITIEDIRVGDPSWQPKPQAGWEEFFSTFTYKPGFTFTMSPDVWTGAEAVWVQMMQEDLFNRGVFVPVSAKMTLPPWEGVEEAMLYTRNKIILGLEQHEMDEWMSFNGNRAFDPHDKKNAHLQIIDGKV